MTTKRFRVRDGYLRWFAPDRFEIQATLQIANPDAFREFLQTYNGQHPDLVEKVGKATSDNPDPISIDQYLTGLIEEYLNV